MRTHSAIRRAVINALSDHVGDIVVHDGRPVFLEEDELPVVAVYLTDAAPTSGVLDDD